MLAMDRKQVREYMEDCLFNFKWYNHYVIKRDIQEYDIDYIMQEQSKLYDITTNEVKSNIYYYVYYKMLLGTL